LFGAEASARIAAASGGIPRTINILCDTALAYGFSAEAQRIDAALVDELIADRARYGRWIPVPPAAPNAPSMRLPVPEREALT
jgi:hypothetical protein